jgi:hypothetical protein
VIAKRAGILDNIFGAAVVPQLTIDGIDEIPSSARLAALLLQLRDRDRVETILRDLKFTRPPCIRSVIHAVDVGKTGRRCVNNRDEFRSRSSCPW